MSVVEVIKSVPSVCVYVYVCPSVFYLVLSLVDCLKYIPKFDMGIDLDNISDGPESQGQRSRLLC